MTAILTRRLLSLCVLPLVLTAATAAEPQPTPQPLPQAHAHNDYLHKRPLLDALDHGFCSVEADIWLRDGKLLVAHDARDLKSERTLEALYLDPLRTRVTANDGRAYKNGPRFWLLIDIKTTAEPTYRALHDTLAKYADILSTTRDGKHEDRAITVVISGNRPIDYVTRQTTRHAGIDGRLTDLDSDAQAHLMPMISDRWARTSIGPAMARCPMTSERSSARSSPRHTLAAASSAFGPRPNPPPSGKSSATPRSI